MPIADLIWTSVDFLDAIYWKHSELEPSLNQAQPGNENAYRPSQKRNDLYRAIDCISFKI